jgi:ABC-type dipeptide/oligopeptide/nickel transport system permease component
MMAALILMAAMAAYAIGAYWLNKRLTPGSRIAAVNEFLGRSVGMFAAAFMVATVFTLLFLAIGAFPASQSQAARNRKAIDALKAGQDSLRLRMDSLEQRIRT